VERGYRDLQLYEASAEYVASRATVFERVGAELRVSSESLRKYQYRAARDIQKCAKFHAPSVNLIDMSLIVWTIWVLFSIYWLWMGVYSIQKLRRNPQWQPRALALYCRFGIRLSARTYILSICVATVLVIASGLWLPTFVIGKLAQKSIQREIPF
jgi:hypothetical protein